MKIHKQVSNVLKTFHNANLVYKPIQLQICKKNVIYYSGFSILKTFFCTSL